MKKFFISIFFLLVHISLYAQVQVIASIDSFSIYIGEQAHVVIDVIVRKGDKIVFPKLQENHYLVAGVELLKVSKADTIELEDDLIKVSKKLTLTSFDEFNYPIPEFKLKVNGKNYQTNPLSLKVVAVDIDTLHLEQMFPPKEVQDNPFLWNDWNQIYLLSIFFIVICFCLFYLVIQIKKTKPIFAKKQIVKHIPAHKKALVRIEDIKKEQWIGEEEQKTYYTKLTEILRRYIEERFGFNALEMTSREIMEKLSQVSNKEVLGELQELFETADLVKFAKYHTLANDNNFNLLNAIEFIQKTKGEDTEKIEVITPDLTSKEREKKHYQVLAKIFVIVLVILAGSGFTYIVYRLWQLIS